jgi:hypothetical protein
MQLDHQHFGNSTNFLVNILALVSFMLYSSHLFVHSVNNTKQPQQADLCSADLKGRLQHCSISLSANVGANLLGSAHTSKGWMFLEK